MVLAGSLVRVGFDVEAFTCLARLAVAFARGGLLLVMVEIIDGLEALLGTKSYCNILLSYFF